MRSTLRALVPPFLVVLSACKKDEPRGAPPPPPPVASAKVDQCASGGGEVKDPISQGFFARRVGAYCIDPQGETKTYGDKGKFSMDEVCTTAFDGECEVYKRFGLARVVSLRYVDGSGGGGQVEVNLSRFADAAGALGMYTARVVAGDPADPATPRVLDAGAAGAIGTGRAYVWRNDYLAELQYNNESESPEQLTKSSEAVLTAVAKDLGQKLPGTTDTAPAVRALPTANRIANGLLFQPKDFMGFRNVNGGALAYYRDGERRWRLMAIVPNDVDQAKDAFKTMRARPGAASVPGLGDEAARVAVQTGSGPKSDWIVVRKGKVIVGVGDEEYALTSGDKDDKGRLTKEEAAAKVKALLDGLAAPVAPAKP